MNVHTLTHTILDSAWVHLDPSPVNSDYQEKHRS